MAAHPLLGGAVAFAVKAPGGLPQVFEHVHEVDEDRHVDFAFGRFGLDPVDLVVVPIDERDPGPRMVGVAPLGLLEDLADDLGGIVGDGRGEPFALGPGALFRVLALALAGGQDVARAARSGGCVVDGADLRDPLAVALLAL